MKIYVALNRALRDLLFEDDSLRRINTLGEVHLPSDDAPGLPADVCNEYDVLVTGWGTPQLARVDGDRLRLIVHSAGSWREALSPEVFDSDVIVSQAGSDPMARAVAEFALTTELVLLREVHTYDRRMQSSRDYAASRQPEFGTAIHAVAHGLIGLSRVGVWHARMLRGLGVKDLVAYDPYVSTGHAEELGVHLVSLEEAMARPVVAAHAPVTAETRGMIDANHLARIPDGGIFVNTARAAIVDCEALEQELTSGRIRAALDVFDEEPLPASSLLYGLPNVILTPHVAGATRQARWEQGRAVVDEIERYGNEEPLQFRVPEGTAGRLS